MAGNKVDNGLPPGFVLEDNPDDNTGLPPGFVLEPHDAPENDPGFLKALGYGTRNIAHGILNTVDQFTPDGEAGSWLSSIHKNSQGAMKDVDALAKSYGVTPEQYGTTHGQQLKWNSPTTWWNHGAGALAEQAPGMVMSLLAPELRGAGFVASEMAQHAGDNLQARMANQAPGATPTLQDKLISGASTGAEAALFGKGLKGINKASGQYLPTAAHAVASNAIAGTGGDLINQVGRTAGTDAGLSVDPTEVANAATMGGVTGAAGKALRFPGDALNAYRGIKLGAANADAAKDLANTLSDTAGGPNAFGNSSSKALADTTGATADLLRTRTSDAVSRASKGPDPLLADGTDLNQRVDQARAQIGKGIIIPEKQLSALQSDLGDQGADVAHAIRTSNVLNIVNGYSSGISNSKVMTSGYNPLNWLGGGGHAVGGLAAILGAKEAMELGHSLSIDPTTGGLAVGALLAAKRGLRGMDNVMGLAHPLSSFVKSNLDPNFTAPKGVPPAPPEDTNANMQLPPAVRAQIMAKQYAAKQMQGFMGGAKGPVGLPEALGFEGSTPPPPEVQGTGPLDNKALAQIALNKMNRANVREDAQTGENAQSQTLAQLAALRQQGLAMMNRRALGGAQVPQGSPQAPPQAPMAPQATPGPPMAPPGIQAPPPGPVFATKARIKQVPMAPPEAANPGAIPETQAPVPNSIKVNGPAPARPPLGGIADKAMGELYARINANKYTPDRLDKTPGVDPETGDFIVNHAGLTATRDSASIEHPDAYKGAVIKNLDVRGNFRDELKGVLPESAGKDVDKLAQLLTNQHVTRVKAEAMIIDLMTEHSGEKHGPAFDKVLMKHIKGLMGTYGQ